MGWLAPSGAVTLSFSSCLPSEAPLFVSMKAKYPMVITTVMTETNSQ